MTSLRRWAAAAVVLLALAVALGAEQVGAQGPPPPPHTFYGSDVRLDGAPAHDGAVVTASNAAGAGVGSAALDGGMWAIDVVVADAASVTFSIDGSNRSAAYTVVSAAVTEVTLHLTSRAAPGGADPPPSDPPRTRVDDPPAGDPPAAAAATDCAFVDGVARVAAATAQAVTARGLGTAFYIGNDEWVTAAHVVEGAGSIRLRTTTLDRAATVIGRDDAADLALLRASGTGLTALPFGDHAALRLGQTLGVAGYPKEVSGTPSVTSGLLSKFDRHGDLVHIQTSAEVNPGNSGGPLFTACGAVVGVVVLKHADASVEGIAWAVALPTINDRLPRLRRGQGVVAPGDGAALRITAICNYWRDASTGTWHRPDTAAACRTAGAEGLRTGAAWHYSARVAGVQNFADVVYRFDGGAAFHFSSADARAAFDALAPGPHTVEARESRGGVWTAWSAPYGFTIRGTAAVLTIGALCNWSDGATAAACRAGAAAGLDPHGGWYLWAFGFEDWGSVAVSVDGGSAVWTRNFALAGLAPGSHTLRIAERRDGVWTPWSVPYTFTIRARVVAPQITAICNMEWDATSALWQQPDTAADCRAAGAAGLRTGAGWDWSVWAAGIESWDNAQEYRFDRGAAFRFGSAEDRAAFDALAPGLHTVEVREWRDGAWTPWSEPYTLTIRVDERAIVVEWLWERYDYVGEQVDIMGAIIDGVHDGRYSYSYGGDLLWALYESLPAWGDALRAEPLPALGGDWSCTQARDWIALSGRALAFMAGWWGVAFRDFPSGDYDDELREAADRYFDSRQESLDAIAGCGQGS